MQMFCTAYISLWYQYRYYRLPVFCTGTSKVDMVYIIIVYVCAPDHHFWKSEASARALLYVGLTCII